MSCLTQISEGFPESGNLDERGKDGVAVSGQSWLSFSPQLIDSESALLDIGSRPIERHLCPRLL